MTYSLRLVSTLAGHDQRVWQAKWNPAAKLLASCSADRTVRLYQYARKESTITLDLATVIDTSHRRSVRSIAWAPSGKLLATASFDSTIGIWEGANGLAGSVPTEWECSSTIEGHENECKCVSYSSTGTLLATCGRDKSVWIWEVQPDSEFDCISVLMEHTQDVKCVAWHPTAEVLVSASYDNTLKLYMDDPADDWYCFATLKGHTSTVWCATFSPCGKYLASCSDDESIIIWQPTGDDGGLIGEWKEICRLAGHTGPVFSISWTAAGHINKDSVTLLASGGTDGSVYLWEIKSGGTIMAERVASIEQAHDADINSVDWLEMGDDGLYLASAGDDGLVKNF
ncbi:Cytosolic iron-sulfur protein assembly protein [Tulasnella sp. 424]|nr:Cytosolic iron-sulfur protein assembly protein [Tulasnella sp. 424]